MTPATIEHAQKHLGDQLYALDATGSRSIEAFMASALTEFTGQSFYVSKSGHQDGSDVRSAPHNFLRVGLESKRYRPSTKLSIDALLHKITDASSASMPVDIWLLAATRPIGASDREKLDEHGETCGIGVIVVDWPDNLRQLCDLAVICASATTACSARLDPTESLSSALTLIQHADDFEIIRTRLLDQFTRADTGYESARIASQRWMVEAQASLANAKSRLRGHHNLGDSSYGVIPRVAINAQLDDWYSGDRPLVALLGDEGMGKSWAAIDWHNRLKSYETGVPLTVFLNATAVGSSNVKSTLAHAIAKQTGVRSRSFWERRLAIWERHATVPILIVIDGLNENFQFIRWAQWLQPLFEDHLHNMYRVIVSCWPNWWQETLVGLTNLAPKPVEIPVKGFNDAELEALLTAMGVKRSDFAKAVLDLMRIPRLSALVATYRERLKHSGDVTAERVVYEDWKDRLARRGPSTGLSDPEMRSFVAKLGEKLQSDIEQAVTRNDVIKSLSDETGKGYFELKPAVTELSSGAWLKPGDQPNTYKVSTERIPFVLAATLMSQLRDETEASAIETRIAEFLDPLKAHRLGAAILRAATTIALVEAETSNMLRRCLLSRWLTEQNFDGGDFEAFWRLAGIDPNLFLDLAEAHWLGRSQGAFRDEVLIKALASAADFAEFEARLRARITKWLGTAWADPTPNADPRRLVQTRPTLDHFAAETRSRHSAWVSDDAAKSFTPIQLDNHHGWSWLSRRAIAILSYLKRAPFACVIEAWALSRAVMKHPWHTEEMAWLLRLNSGDPTETADAVYDIVACLSAQQRPICKQAADYLNATMSHIKRASVPVVLSDAPEKPAAPMSINSMDATALYNAAQKVFSRPADSPCDPATKAALLNALIQRGLESNEAALSLLVDHLADFLIVLTPLSRALLLESLAAQQNSTGHDRKGRKPAAAKRLSAELALQLYDADSKDQATLILSSGIGAARDEWMPLYRPITLDDIEPVDLSNVPATHLSGWLDYVGNDHTEVEIAKLGFLPTLINHDHQSVRDKALQLASRGRHYAALQEFVNSPFALSPREGEDTATFDHEYWRNRALLEFCEFSPDASVSKHLDPECAALILQHRPSDPEALGHFNKYLRGEFEAIRTEQSWSSSRYWRSHQAPIEALAEHDLNTLLDWLTPWLDDSRGVPGRAYMTFFPVIDTMYALSSRAPDTSLNLYEALLDASRPGFFSSEGIATFPFEVQASTRSDNLCNMLLAQASTDQMLLEISFAAHMHGRLDWLFEWIVRLEANPTPADVAKAYTLLGFADEGIRAESLWRDFITRPPLDPWLNDVLRASANDYERNRIARNAYESLWSSATPDVAQQAVLLFRKTTDMRMTFWIESIAPEWNDWPYDQRVALSLASKSLNKRMKKNNERRKKTYLHTPLAFSQMAPWCK